jgi:hypothetical protein
MSQRTRITLPNQQTPMTTTFLRNPHLDGDAFFRQASKVGALLIHGFTAMTAEDGGRPKITRELHE